MSNRPAADAYVKWFYDSGVWKDMTWHGIRTLKFPADIWNYQEIIFERKVEHVIETGTRHGGSAIFFAQTLAARGAAGPVVSIDIDTRSRAYKSCQGVHFLEGDSAAPEMVEKAFSFLPEKRGTLFLILDSDHSRDHVLRELNAWVPRLRSGDYLIVEDTNVNGHPVRPEHGPGPWEAVDDFLRDNAALVTRDELRETKFGATFAPRGYFVRN